MLKLFFYKIRLLLSLGIFAIQLIANGSHKTKPLILILFIIGLSLILGGVFYLKKEPVLETVVIASSVIPKNTTLYEVEQLTTTEIQNRISYLEEVKAKQPLSRDILLNLSQLYSAVGKHETALHYKEQAFQIDPNNPLFE